MSDPVPGADDLVRRAAALFEADASVPPPLTLRGGYALDRYDAPATYDPDEDAPTDAYLEDFAYWGLIYLDARSWRHYLPRLVAYAFAHPDDPHMVVEGLILSLRPPDRYPPRLATLNAAQESLVRAFLETVATSFEQPGLPDDALQALAEWWWPDARHRPPAERAAEPPATYVAVDAGACTLTLPASFRGSSAHIPAEARTSHVWRGTLGGDVPTMIAVNVSHGAAASWRAIVARDTARLGADARPYALPGATRARRIDGLLHDASPAEPKATTMLLGAVGDDLVTLTVQTYPEARVAADVERIVRSFSVRR